MIAKIVTQNLLAIVAAYCKATGTSLTWCSKKFYGNAGFFDQLKAGKHSVSVGKLDEMVTEFRAVWPENAEWPHVRPIHMGRKPPSE